MIKSQMKAASLGTHPFFLEIVCGTVNSGVIKGQLKHLRLKPPSTIRAFALGRDGHTMIVAFQVCRSNRPGILLSRLYQAGSDQDALCEAAVARQDHNSLSPVLTNDMPSPQTTKTE